MSKLSPTTVNAALNSHTLLGDTDLFPRQPEIDIIARHAAEFVTLSTTKDINSIEFGASRRFVVPKDDFSLRVATQFDPFDSIALTSLMLEFGHLIESKRLSQADQVAFSYRFSPQTDGRLFSPSADWTSFWERCLKKASECAHVGYLDVTDFYNQIYHHVIENQLNECGWPPYAVKYVNRLLGFLTAKISRGIPVGPYASHMLAEASMIPIDQSIRDHGIDHCRFVDDIIFFADSEINARSTLFKIAEILDQQQRLTINRTKTTLFDSQSFITHARSMVDDRPLTSEEASVLTVINRYTRRSPYVTVPITTLSPADLLSIPDALIEGVIRAYTRNSDIDFPRLRWFLRRISQIGHPGAIEVIVEWFERLLPALPDIAHYFISAAPNYKGDWKSLGGDLFEMLEHPIVRANDFLQISILSLFHRNIKLNHLGRLVSVQSRFSPDVQREIILILGAHGSSAVLREMKDKFPGLTPWSRRAFLASAITLPKEERGFLTKAVRPISLFEELLIKELKK